MYKKIMLVLLIGSPLLAVGPEYIIPQRNSGNEPQGKYDGKVLKRIPNAFVTASIEKDLGFFPEQIDKSFRVNFDGISFFSRRVISLVWLVPFVAGSFLLRVARGND